MNNLNLKLELDPVFETIGLLHLSSYEEYKKRAISELEIFVLDSEAFYNKHLKHHDKYIQSFKKYKVVYEQEKFFFDKEDELVQFIFLAINLIKQWMHSLEEISQHDIRMQIFEVLIQSEANNDINLTQPEHHQINDLSYIVDYLNRTSLSETTKWKLMTIMGQPHKYLSELITIINGNLPAYEKTKQDMNKPLQKLLHNLNQTITKNKELPLVDMSGIPGQETIVYPSFVMPLGQITIHNLCYYGLMLYLLPGFKQNEQHTHELLLTRLKALSDQSKLQIIHSLKISPKYNLEIAEQLGLTAATTSHHMNVLLACNLVSIDKKNGKVYYHVEREQLRQFVQELEQFLL